MTGSRIGRVRKEDSIAISCDRETGWANDDVERSTMDTRKLGKNGPAVPALGLGCMGMTGIYGEPNEPESIATIHRAIDLGVNLIVTSDAYGAGANEELVGRAIKGKRNRVLLATKFGNMGLSGFKLAEGLSGGHPGYVPARAQGASARCARDRVLAVVARCGKGHPPRLPRARYRLHGVFSSRARVPHRHDQDLGRAPAAR